MRCARPHASTMCRWMSSTRWRARYAGDLRRMDASAERLAAWSSAALDAADRYREARGCIVGSSKKSRRAAWSNAVNGELKPLRLERAKFSPRLTVSPMQAARTASIASNSGSRPIPARGPAP